MLVPKAEPEVEVRGRSALEQRREHDSDAMTASNHDSLHVAVEAAGEAWACDCADTLRAEGRAIAGGWPGTMTEARLRAAACAALHLGTPAVAPDLLDGLARRAYACAKRAWLARTGPEED